MNRVQKKCLIVSAALHVLLLGVILFGAALMPEDRSAPFKPIKLYSLANVTDAPSSGGSPNVVSAPLPPAPQPPAPVRPDPPEPPTPRSAPVSTREPEAVRPPPKFTLNPNELKLAKRDNVKPPKDNQAAADKATRQAAEDRRLLFNKASQNIRSISKDFSASTEVALSGPGDGGPSAANYRDIVASKYYAAWNTPNVSDDPGTVTVSVTIARDGSVVAHRVIKRSGNAATDKSVEITLENVTFIEVFPASSNDQERTYTIIFDPIVKRSLG